MAIISLISYLFDNSSSYFNITWSANKKYNWTIQDVLTIQYKETRSKLMKQCNRVCCHLQNKGKIILPLPNATTPS